MKAYKKSPGGLVVIGAILLASCLSTASAQSTTISVEAGPIWSQSDASTKCPQVAKENGGVWNGQWKTTVPGRMSVCEIRLSRSRGRSVTEAIEAGPIWNQADANKKCAQLATENGGVWNGQWKTTVPGRMSVCEIRFPSRS
ncbi:MAG TPA: mannan-binding lectin [Candidatus Cybelea sp.]|jgi:hypothetical protein|nr:mannan-binding lectin [Candidatus Cybelea sp.]